MDIEANMKEQAAVAEEIMQLWDKCPEDGDFTYRQLDGIAQQAYRLAELVQAVHEYRFNRNPPAESCESSVQVSV